MNDGHLGAPVRAHQFLEHVAAVARTLSGRAANEPFEETVAVIVVEAARGLQADRAAVWLERGEAIEVVATTGMRPTVVDRFQRFEVGQPARFEGLLRRNSPIEWASHLEAQTYFRRVDVENFGSGIVIPIGNATTCSGVLFVGWQREQRVTCDTERTFLETLADCCAVAVERADSAHQRHEGVSLARRELVRVDDLCSIQTSASDGQTIAWIIGAIDISNSQQLAHALDDIAVHADGRLIIDLEAVTFFALAAARVIVQLTRSRDTAEVAIRNASPVVDNVLSLITRENVDRER